MVMQRTANPCMPVRFRPWPPSFVMIETLVLTDFRNHTMCRIKTHGRRNVIITGPNGAGKTAILESLSILSGDRGMRGAQMSDIARFNGNGGFSVFAISFRQTKDNHIRKRKDFIVLVVLALNAPDLSFEFLPFHMAGFSI